ncbi:potassium channel subfamily K member 3-like [Actinia tenebrosa]|uniref:Potassium channel subfamily K member 3-like n=1 Tax=Actinia tenebrosa TaxID=6105 RepID=A0A6P8HBC8_ACTTE|nr:potassium channel subfamily K member 3-like [Actinia tenebrosa]
MAIQLKSDTKRLFCLVVLLGVYLFCGAAVFQVLENENEAHQVDHLNGIRQTLFNKYNISKEEFDFLVRKIEMATKYGCGGPPDSWCISRWSYYASLYFTWSVVTTIGYGHLAPATMEGRIFCMVFAFFGIPLNLMILKNIGDRVNDLIHYIHYLVIVKLSKKDVEVLRTRTLVWTLGFVIIMLLFGATLYSQTEHWNFFDGIYFCFVTFSTIGFGDLVPNQGGPPKNVPDGLLEVLRALVIILGLSMFFSIISSILSASEELRLTFPLTRKSKENGDKIQNGTIKKSDEKQNDQTD